MKFFDGTQMLNIQDFTDTNIHVGNLVTLVDKSGLYKVVKCTPEIYLVLLEDVEGNLFSATAPTIDRILNPNRLIHDLVKIKIPSDLQGLKSIHNVIFSEEIIDFIYNRVVPLNTLYKFNRLQNSVALAVGAFTNRAAR